ncbi:hypothetical protein pb186bvf_014336 [Paramecium bursaria]
MKSLRPSTAKKNTLPPPKADLNQYMQELYEHQKSCERAGKYLEADEAKKRLALLKVEMESQTKDSIRDRHFQEKNEFEKTHQEELNSFNQFWDGKVKEFIEQSTAMKEELIQRHQKDLESFIQELEESIPTAPKDSAELLSLKKQEEQLAKQESYAEAHVIQQRIIGIQKEENEKWNIQRNMKIRNIIQQMKQKQQSELNVIQQRIQSGIDEQKRTRLAEEEKLKNKYYNVRKDLESKQVQELTKLDKSFKNQSISSLSKQSKMNSSQDDQFQNQGSPYK